MDVFVNILFWLGVFALVDGSLGILLKEKWQKMAGEMDIQKIALIEIGLAWVFLILYFVLQYGFGG
ncbi:hypothetical protein [Pontiella agarivorans]|uniref:Uncharacterized protein n=1 Tax=Pontiella agarivorans TaxID=3038953 RepID=A0ABU5MXS2_9BACT|nr:hypothetical protein [Pontiella agarivorans]MDZ8118999.1 hypothetical protein [Pontiella agarivorans]